MHDYQNRPALKTILRGSAVAGLAAIISYGGAPYISEAFADPVKLEATSATGFADVVSAVSPAVVSIRVKGKTMDVADAAPNSGFGDRFQDLPEDHPMRRFFDQFGGDHGGQSAPAPRMSQGSGFFISEDGYLVTNNHVVEGGSEFTVVLGDETELQAKLIGKDSRTDLALLKVEAERPFAYVQFAQEGKTRVGDWVVAIGNPFGLGGSVTAGIVSGLGRNIGSGPYDDYIQIDAAVNTGNSGGPAFNQRGEVVGINTAIFSPSGGNVGVAFAIPAYVAEDVVQDLKDDGRVERGWLGVQIQPVTEDVAESLSLEKPQGALIVEPQEGSPGAKAGLEPGDVILSMDGDPVKDARDLSLKVASAGPNKEVDLSIWREGEEKSVEVTLGDLADTEDSPPSEPDQQAVPAADQEELLNLGLTVAPADDGTGLVIAKVDPNSEAAQRGLVEGERITSINNRPVTDVGKAKNILTDAKSADRGHALFQIESENGSRFVALPIQQS
ncbi:MAG TPA: Do family serine endopeptidase [Pseudorhizobium sp.]|jgi:serine protease Do|nr:Do family serine endopeptidase [Pseudorhizobium sp.]